MVNGVPREVPRPKLEGQRAPRVFGFWFLSLLWHPRLVKRDFCQPTDCLGSIMVNVCPSLDQHWYGELNPNVFSRKSGM